MSFPLSAACLFAAVLFAPGLLAQDAAVGPLLTPRAAYDTGPVRAAPLPADLDPALAANIERRLTIKFVDAVRGRADGTGGLASRASADLSAVRTVAAAHGLSFRPLISIDETTLAKLEQRAASRSGRAQPDLAGILAVETATVGLAELESIGQQLQDLAMVEYAFIQHLGTPPPGDIAPTTPNLSGSQGYFGASSGMDVDGAHALGARGAGVRISDCEYGWNPNHEDLLDIDLHLEPGQTITQSTINNGWDSHGTAAIGEASSVDNPYGCTGMAPDAAVYTYPEASVEQGYRRVTAISNAINDSGPGDVVLLEMQAFGAGGSYVPAEYDPSVHGICSLGVDAGVIVVGAAGNGNQNLDAAAYATYMGYGDSGAIIVGAGSSNSSHNKLSFSTYGSRVNLQGWGQNVFTLGYGDFAQYGGDKDQRYTSGFNGTSSASPFVASAAAMGSAHVLASTGAPVDPVQLRQILIDTGTAQGSGGQIGPLPDIPAALNVLGNIVQGFWTNLGNGLSGLLGVPDLAASGPLTEGSLVELTLTNAFPVGPTNLIAGLAQINAPFKGGVLVPSPDILVLGLPVFVGKSEFSFTFPAGVPSGTELIFQHWVSDPSGPSGFSASNAMMATSP